MLAIFTGSTILNVSEGYEYAVCSLNVLDSVILNDNEHYCKYRELDNSLRLVKRGSELSWSIIQTFIELANYSKLSLRFVGISLSFNVIKCFRIPIKFFGDSKYLYQKNMKSY